MPESTPLAPTSATDIRQHRTVVALPVAQDGVTIAVEIVALPPLDVIRIMKGIPGVAAADAPAAGPRDFGAIERQLVERAGPVAELVAAAVIAPTFSFNGPREGCARWDHLLVANQTALVAAIMELSGWDGKGAGDASAASFPADGAGQ